MSLTLRFGLDGMVTGEMLVTPNHAKLPQPKLGPSICAS